MVERFAGSALRERIAAARRVRTELPFAFTLEPPGAGGRTLVVNGVVDVHATEPGGVLVVDYKSDALDGRDPEELTAGAYATQRLVYALAALRAGAERVVVAHCYLERPGEPAIAEYPPAGGRPRGRAPRGGPRSRRGALRAHRRAPPRPLRRLPRPRRALQLGPRADARRGRLSPLSVRGSAYLATCPSTRIEGETGQMPLCFIEPQEAIRVVAESVGREARRQLLGEVVRAWVDEIPDDELPCTTPRPWRSSTTTICPCSPPGTRRSRSGTRSPTRSSCSARSGTWASTAARRFA